MSNPAKDALGMSLIEFSSCALISHVQLPRNGIDIPAATVPVNQ
jgi:hypothetical protein